VAFGADAVLLSPTSCDPLYRKAIRVSVGGTLRMPFAYLPRWPEELGELRRHGYFIVALTPHETALEIGAIASPDRPAKLALVAGAEGVGLSAKALASADALVRIPMVPGVDSLNLATATGIALHRLSRRC
jgi:tRNA G18 (ribose-2'-O)-methylase SpoU